MATKKKKTFRFNRLKILVLIGVVVYASLTFFNQQTILATQHSKQEELLSQQEELNKQIEYYENEKDYIGTDEWVEREARERLGWLKPGEKKYVEPENGTAPSSPPEESDDAAPSASPSTEPTE